MSTRVTDRIAFVLLLSGDQGEGPVLLSGDLQTTGDEPLLLSGDQARLIAVLLDEVN